MNIAVVDVAAEKSGALTVLNDFIDFITSNSSICNNHMWYVYTSVPIECDKEYINNIIVPEAKKGRIRRLLWDRINAISEFKNKKIDVVISLQNAGFKKGSYHQLVYFHNVLLLEDKNKYSLLKKNERSLAIYTRFISKYTLHTLKYVDCVVAQTDTVKKKIGCIDANIKTTVIRPNIHIEKKYKNSFCLPIKGIICPTSPSEYKKIDEIICCVRNNKEWFIKSGIKVYITIKGDENNYAQEIYDSCNGLGDVIKLIGKIKREDLFEMYRSCVLLVSSCRESFPMPFLEAAFIGAPIIAAGYDYAYDCLKDFKNVFYYSPGDINQLLSSVKDAIEISAIDYNDIYEEKNTWEEFVYLMNELAL